MMFLFQCCFNNLQMWIKNILLWNYLKRAANTRHLNMTEVNQFCKDEWPKSPPEFCTSLICSYQEHLLELTAAKGGSISYESKGSLLLLTRTANVLCLCVSVSFTHCKCLYLILMKIWSHFHYKLMYRNLKVIYFCHSPC